MNIQWNQIRNKIQRNFKLYILLILQTASLFTTIKGAKIVLSSLDPYYIFGIKIEAYILLGIGIQFFLLWLFTIGKNEIKSPWRKVTLMLIYTFASIYTSFFSFYEGLIQENLADTSNKIAIRKHIKLKSFIYQDHLDRLNDIDRRIETAQNNYSLYFDNGDRRKVREETERIIKLKQQRDSLDKKYGHEVKSNFLKTNQKLKSQKAQEIFEDDERALDSLSNNTLEDLEEKGFKREDFNKDKYVPEVSYFLVPFSKVKQGKAEAILALLLASIIDGTSLIIGSTAYNDKENKERLKKIAAKIVLLTNALSRGLKELLPNLIEETGHLIFTILRAFGSIIHGSIFGLLNTKNRGLQVFFYNVNSIKVKGDRQEFLSNLWKSVEFYWDKYENNQDGVKIVYKKLISSTQNHNESFKTAYKRVLMDMYNLGWLEKQIHKDEIIFKIKKYNEFIDWYQKEESKQVEQEKHSMLYPNDYYTLIDRPKKEAFHQRTSKKLKFWLQQVF